MELTLSQKRNLMEEIEFTIHSDGRVEYTIHGIKGASCEDVSRLFEALGAVTESRKTGEFYEKENETKIIQQRQ